MRSVIGVDELVLQMCDNQPIAIEARVLVAMDEIKI